MIHTKEIDMPVFLRHCEVLFESGYMSKVAVRRLARNIQVELDKQGGKASKEALEAVKDFSYWIHERI